MALERQRKNFAYGIGNPLSQLVPEPIIANRAPTTSDKAELGSTWVYKATNQSWVLASIVANSATWTPLTVNAGATITTGNLTVVAGNIIATAGDITATAGDITATAGDIVATAGAITATAGDITATAGALVAGTTVTAGTGVTATTGGVTAAAGDITATLGDLISSAGAVDAATTVTAGTGVTATTGDVTATFGDVVSTAGDVFAEVDVTANTGTVRGVQINATGDITVGTASEVGITNVVDTTLSTGAGVVLMKTANPGDSSGWLKIYVGTDVRYIPYWTTINP